MKSFEVFRKSCTQKFYKKRKRNVFIEKNVREGREREVEG